MKFAGEASHWRKIVSGTLSEDALRGVNPPRNFARSHSVRYLPAEFGADFGMDGTITDTFLRLGAAVLGGMAIGINRDLTNKPIGMRTLGLVALGAAAITLEAVQFRGLIDNQLALARVIQGVIEGIMTGIGFIGAGVILRDREAGEVHGLTTAASVWVTAALGIVCGLAAWRVAAALLILTLVILVAVRWFEEKLGVKS